MGTDVQSTNKDFSIALTGLYTQAHAHGVDTCVEETRALLVQQAKVIAQLSANNRRLYNLIHRINDGGRLG